MKLSVIICVYNEKNTLLEILKRVQDADIGQDWSKEIIIVDNFSTDGTRDLLQTISAQNVKIVLQTRNLGKGSSIRTAIPLCTGDYTITQDADLEYHPRQYKSLLLKALENNLDAVYGSRVLGDRRYHHYAVNYWAVRFLTGLTNRLFGSSFTDVATNYKLVRTELLKTLRLRCSGFDLDFEISNKLALSTRKIAEVPIDFEPRTYGQGKKINALDGLKALYVILRNRLVG